MSLLELIFVVTSVIVGLGIAEILTGVVRVFRGELRGGLAQSLWTVIIFTSLVQLVWAYWGMNSVSSLTYAEYLVILAGPVMLFLAASLLFPDPASGFVGSLDDYLIEHRTPFLLAWLMFIVQAQTLDSTIPELPGDNREALLLRIVVAAVTASALFVERRWWQTLVPAAVLALSFYFAARITPVAVVS